MSYKKIGRDGWGDAPVSDEVNFRAYESTDIGGNPESRVEVRVNGEPLTKVLGLEEYSMLPLAEYDAGTHLELWGPDALPESLSGLSEGDGSVAVLVHGCGDFGCGGVAAKVIFAKDRVVWADFHAPYGRGGVPARPLVFARDQYMTALRNWAWV